MDTEGSFHFMNFPFEIQQLILWKCLEGWKATVESHEKPKEKKSTTRLWSSVVYDALMLSLTCKHFHKIIQHIQKDPRLFSGEVDLIEANAEISHLVGVFTSRNDQYYIIERDSIPRPLYRTQIFIKANPYDKSDPNWRASRLKYHAGVRNWLNQNVRSLGIWADEMTSSVPWEMFPSLENITVYWPSTYLKISESNLLICEHSEENLVSMAKYPKNLISAWDLSEVIASLRVVAKPGVRVTVKYEVPHLHVPECDFELNDDNVYFEKVLAADYYNLECAFTVENGEWTKLNATCHGQSPMDLEADQKERFAELSVIDY